MRACQPIRDGYVERDGVKIFYEVFGAGEPTVLSSIVGEILGCFAMTETGHGSDVQQLRTTCTYDAGTQTFDLHTPHQAARKDYIGNAAKDGRMAVVFAQLVTAGPGEEPHSRGVHCLLVPLRDEDGRDLPGVTTSDCGVKGGLNGVDNGRIVFDQVRVPRENLLDRYASVAEDGTYSSPIENPNRRFFTMLGTLIRGRVSIAGASGAAARQALAIAVRYALRRRQFGAPGAAAGEPQEVLLMDYRTHQRRLLPALARAYALQTAQNGLVETLSSIQGEGAVTDPTAQRNLEALAAGGTSFDALYVNVNGASGYFDRSLAVYGQADRPCRRCGTPIRRDPFMNRSSYSCPRCQPRPRAAPRERPSAGEPAGSPCRCQSWPSWSVSCGSAGTRISSCSSARR